MWMSAVGRVSSGSSPRYFVSEVRAFRDRILECGCSSDVLCCPLKSSILVCGSHNEIVHRCSFCDCVFSSFLDLELHLNAFGRVGSFHREGWHLEKVRRGFEYGELVRVGRGFRRSKGSWFSEHG